MPEHLQLMAAHVRSVAQRDGAEAQAGTTLMQVRAHLADPDWARWLSQTGVPESRASELMAIAEHTGIGVDALRPPELRA